jgi:peptidyl-prolyl cis-trans isomerase A (cyclophilin A)
VVHGSIGNRVIGLLALGSLWMGIALGEDAAQPAASPASSSATSVPLAGGEVVPPVAAASVKVVLRTTLGDIVLALEKERAPVTVNNFLRYVDQKRLDGSNFYRAVKFDDMNGLIQGGLRGNPKRVFKPIAHEPTSVTGLSHLSGAISMARAEPGTATADFFIVIGDQVAYDAAPEGGDPGYAVFGRVVEGMDVVHAIMEQPISPDTREGEIKGQMIANPVKILTARRAG